MFKTVKNRVWAFDALTTYLVWLRVAHFGGHFTGEEYEVEQQLVRELILSEIKNGKIHLKKYLETGQAALVKGQYRWLACCHLCFAISIIWGIANCICEVGLVYCRK